MLQQHQACCSITEACSSMNEYRARSMSNLQAYVAQHPIPNWEWVTLVVTFFVPYFAYKSNSLNKCCCHLLFCTGKLECNNKLHSLPRFLLSHILRWWKFNEDRWVDGEQCTVTVMNVATKNVSVFRNSEILKVALQNVQHSMEL